MPSNDLSVCYLASVDSHSSIGGKVAYRDPCAIRELITEGVRMSSHEMKVPIWNSAAAYRGFDSGSSAQPANREDLVNGWAGKKGSGSTQARPSRVDDPFSCWGSGLGNDIRTMFISCGTEMSSQYDTAA